MSTVPSILRLFSVRNVVQKNTRSSYLSRPGTRTYADTPKPDSTSKQIVAQGPENEERVRVRRARASDVPRVLRFVRENVRVAWPALDAPPAAAHLVIADYVSRALAQDEILHELIQEILWNHKLLGHSMLAEQQESHRGWSKIRGLALSTALCPWDAAMLERWARCVKCSRSRKLMNLTAHCLRGPALHDKYRVHNILQVVVIVPPDTPNAPEIINVLAKNAIQRGREVGFPLIRFDVSNDLVSTSLEQLKLKKEWQLSYEILPHMKDKELPSSPEKEVPVQSTVNRHKLVSGNYIAVYTTFTGTDKNVPTTSIT